MKTSVLIKDGKTQVVLSPENDAEMAVLELLHTAKSKTYVYRGVFDRHSAGYDTYNALGRRDTIIVTVPE